MAKFSHSYSFKGVIYTEDMSLEEFDPKTEVTTEYDLMKYLKEFNGKTVSFTIKEETAVE